MRYRISVWMDNEDAPVVVADNLTVHEARVALIDAQGCWPFAQVDLEVVG